PRKRLDRVTHGDPHCRSGIVVRIPFCRHDDLAGIESYIFTLYKRCYVVRGHRSAEMRTARARPARRFLRLREAELVGEYCHGKFGYAESQHEESEEGNR